MLIIFFSETWLGVCYKARFIFLSRYDLSVLQGNLLASLQYFEGDKTSAKKKRNFTF